MGNRLVVIVLLLAIGGGIWYWRQYASERDAALLQKRALVTAQIWLASAKYRKDEHKFLAVRDSLLTVSGFSKEEMTAYLKQYESEAEEYNSFTELVGTYVDSLAKMKIKPADTIVRKDSIK